MPIPVDTTLDAARIHYAALERIGPAGRVRQMAELCENVRSVLASGIRQRHPHSSEQDIHDEVMRLTLGDDLYRKVNQARQASSQ